MAVGKGSMVPEHQKQLTIHQYQKKQKEQQQKRQRKQKL